MVKMTTKLHTAIILNDWCLFYKHLYEYINTKDIDGYSPMMLSYNLQKYDFTYKLIENGANVNEIDNQGNTLLHYFSYNNNFNAIYKLYNLLKNKIDINQKNEQGNTPYIEAAIYKNYKYMSLLKNDKNLNIYEVNNENKTAEDYLNISILNYRDETSSESDINDIDYTYSESDMDDYSADEFSD